MKIIRKGVIPEKPKPIWVDLNVVCKNCSCLFVLEEGDKVSSLRQPFDDNPTFTVNCPQCLTYNVVRYERSIRYSAFQRQAAKVSELQGESSIRVADLRTKENQTKSGI